MFMVAIIWVAVSWSLNTLKFVSFLTTKPFRRKVWLLNIIMLNRNSNLAQHLQIFHRIPSTNILSTNWLENVCGIRLAILIVDLMLVEIVYRWVSTQSQFNTMKYSDIHRNVIIECLLLRRTCSPPPEVMGCVPRSCATRHCIIHAFISVRL